MQTIRSSLTAKAFLAMLVALLVATTLEAKLMRRPIFDDAYDSQYGASSMPVPTGDRAIITVRGARNTYDGHPPTRLTIDDQPYRGPYPRGVYDRVDRYSPGGGRGRMPLYPNQDFGYGGYGSSLYNGGGYGSGFDGAPSRLAVTGAYPYRFGSRGYF